MKGRQRVVSLADELELVANAIEGLEILLDQLAHDDLATETQERRTPHAVAAVLVLVEQRLRLGAKLARGELDPKLIFHAANEQLDEGGVGLEVWSPELRRKKAKK